jgi:peptidoglycan/xylan/chitin deacetylase (PgdA/CDA1 family)
MRIFQILLTIVLLAGALAITAGTASAAVNAQSAPITVDVEGGDYTLTLAPGGNAIMTEKAPSRGDQVQSWSGSWVQAGESITVRLVATDTGAALKRALILEGVIVDGVFDVTGVGMDNIVYDREDLELTLGSGQRHPLVRTLNRFLAEIPVLNYTYPATNDNVYTEDVRRAVARFQEIEGLTPSGLLDLRTLLALTTPTRPRLDLSRVEFTVTPEVVNVRSGPSTDYPVIQRAYQGDTFEVVGKVGSGAPRDIWVEVCCFGNRTDWIRSDLGAVSGDLNLIETVPADQLPPAPQPAQPTTGRGQPLLANLPTTTPEGNPVVYLTFDDGPNGAFTQQMLDLLAQYDARATFFVIGQQVAGGVDVLRRMASEGSYIGNHTWDHVWLDQISKEEFVDQIQRTRNELLAVAGDLFTLDGDVLYVRPPYGAMNADDRQWMAELGYTTVLWDIDPQDWRRPGVETIANHVISHVFPGAIVLMHDGGGERTQSMAALEIILRELSAQGYRFYNIFGQ